ncbi:glycoside hydrolase family 53 protein [Bacteroides heparinolyticus]|uniref:glycoside hydrolase family 53 protein n=1 Tax=Prevotella heparinolytica TaxID=28113 RepID=UPI0035A02D67
MEFIKGMDISMVDELERNGARYYLNGTPGDLFSILNECGTNTIRLRLWQDPYDKYGNPYGGGGNDFETTINLAKRTIENKMDFLLDFHYSDFWADPAKQIKPKAWSGLNSDELETAVYLYTLQTLKALRNQKLIPSMIQIGNEITNGLLWPEGHIDNIQMMTRLLKAGIKGAREECPEAKIVLHLDFGTDNQMYRNWFEGVSAYTLDYDIIGMSYYPHFNGSIASLIDNMNDVSDTFNKDVMIAETSIGYTLETYGCKGIVYTKQQELDTGYPATQEGQRDFLKDLYSAVRGVKNSRGVGVFYWEPDWLPIPNCTWGNKNGCIYMNDDVEAGNAMANQALFDDCGNANLALLSLKEM